MRPFQLQEFKNTSSSSHSKLLCKAAGFLKWLIIKKESWIVAFLSLPAVTFVRVNNSVWRSEKHISEEDGSGLATQLEDL